VGTCADTKGKKKTQSDELGKEGRGGELERRQRSENYFDVIKAKHRPTSKKKGSNKTMGTKGKLLEECKYEFI